MTSKWSNKEWAGRSLRRPQYAREDDKPAKHRTKKNTRKWCKGKPGVEHQWDWGIDSRFLGYPWATRDSRHYINTCTVCGKHNHNPFGFYIICIESERDKRWVEQRMKGLWAWWG